MHASRRGGFTLIELLIVIAIIGMLSTLSVVALNSARQRSRDAKRVADIRQIQTALELGYTESQRYPASPTDNVIGSSTTSSVLCSVGLVPTWQNTQAGCTTLYMGLVPSNPTPNGMAYWYDVNANFSSYRILFSLEGQTGQLAAGNLCANENGITIGTGC